MTQYFIAEENTTPFATNATTLASAKRVAARAQAYQGTSMYVLGQTKEGEFYTISAKIPDAINRRIKGTWRDQ